MQIAVCAACGLGPAASGRASLGRWRWWLVPGSVAGLRHRDARAECLHRGGRGRHGEGEPPRTTLRSATAALLLLPPRCRDGILDREEDSARADQGRFAHHLRPQESARVGGVGQQRRVPDDRDVQRLRRLVLPGTNTLVSGQTSTKNQGCLYQVSLVISSPLALSKSSDSVLHATATVSR
jgi:hypothetical protein